jgi:hypothetical protein
VEPDCSRLKNRMIAGSLASSRCTASRALGKMMHWKRQIEATDEDIQVNNSLVVLVATAGGVVVVGLRRVAHWRCVVAVGLAVAIVGVAALLWWHAVVVAAVLVLVHVLRRVVLVGSAVSVEEEA